MISVVLADTPQWVEDGKNYAALIASLGAAMTGAWRYVVKPYLDRQEWERRNAIEKARIERQHETEEMLAPLREQMRQLQTDVNRVGDKSILLGDAVSATNKELVALKHEQESLHRAVREHMQAEDAKKDGH